MSYNKVTPFISDLKDFFKNSDMTAAILGFKCLCMAVTDGISQLLLDFDFVGEKGKKGNYGKRPKELAGRRSVKRDNVVFTEREESYAKSKI